MSCSKGAGNHLIHKRNDQTQTEHDRRKTDQRVEIPAFALLYLKKTESTAETLQHKLRNMRHGVRPSLLIFAAKRNSATRGLTHVAEVIYLKVEKENGSKCCQCGCDLEREYLQGLPWSSGQPLKREETDEGKLSSHE